jgi:folate-binding protein YgfZ
MADMTSLQSLREAAVFVDGAGHDVLRATGNDRVTFLHRITSGTIAGKAVGQGSRTLLLDVKGRVLASLLVFVRPKSLRLLVAGGQGADLAAGLAKYAIMDDFQIVPEAEVATLAILGPRAAAALADVSVPVPPTMLESPLFDHLDVTSEAFGPLWIAHGRACGTDGLCVVASRSAREALVAALLAKGTPRLEPGIAEALRISALEPKPGSEVLPERFPVEVGLGAAIDHGKGCYVGQETIVRMRDRGIIRKRLVLLRLSSENLPAPGDKVSTAEQPAAGQVTSVGGLPGELPVALAIVASAVPVGATLQIQHAEARLAAQVVAESVPWGKSRDS